MEQKANSFLATEPLGALMAKYSVPCVISLLVAALYNIVDQIFVGNSILFSFLGGLVIILISYGWGDGLLRLIGATDANLSLARDYGFIIYAMMPLALVQNTLASIIRADGSPKYAMGAMLVGAVLNIIGDPVAIFLQSIGHAKAAAPLSILRDVLLIVFSIAAPVVWGVTGIFWAAPIADVLAIAVTAAVMLRLWNQLKAELICGYARYM